jgi:hypothetical protein
VGPGPRGADRRSDASGTAADHYDIVALDVVRHENYTISYLSHRRRLTGEKMQSLAWGHRDLLLCAPGITAGDFCSIALIRADIKQGP